MKVFGVVGPEEAQKGPRDTTRCEETCVLRRHSPEAPSTGGEERHCCVSWLVLCQLNTTRIIWEDELQLKTMRSSDWPVDKFVRPFLD